MRTIVMLSFVALAALACASTEKKADPVEPAKTDAPADAPPADAPPADAPPADAAAAPAPAPATP
jgi:hypothetical protein